MKKWTKLFGIVALTGVITACGDTEEEVDEAGDDDSNDVEETEGMDDDDTETEDDAGGEDEDDEVDADEEDDDDEDAEAAEGADDDVLNIAHRGASGHAPEQTMPAIEKAADMDVDWIEMDIQMTADDELVAFHDVEVDRTTDAEGDLKDFTLEELQEMDAGSWFNEEHPDYADEAFEGESIVTLEEVIEALGTDENYYIETKDAHLYDGIEEAMVELVEEHNLIEEDSVIIQSFEQDSLHKVQELNDEIPLVQLLWWEVEEDEEGELVMDEWLDVTAAPDEMTEEDFAEIHDYAIGIGPHLEYYDGTEVIDEDFVSTAQDNDLDVHIYTINDEETMERLVDWSVDGIFTDYPDRLNDVLGR
ncbi:glycerophosphoryl diester phosphodiesterase [Salsuginibacillus halophilus]|uniref:Glycerophosphoryl diester phosphodiesterase n=1 Tax=Salsuginibacillus halophilus TaxID=517424 RepID=A0A2P8HI00_9BACI|nr:glycerophosphodiester phosphodiesterase family protein [Salsuginibacillus halophilus]PSL45843.1 glycerophosphoryl diester phosphodiesterase [Salsuginibacillus halophilus]